jgi:hypothetical protein
MVQLCSADNAPKHVGGHVFLNEERAKVRLGEEHDPVDVPLNRRVFVIKYFIISK